MAPFSLYQKKLNQLFPLKTPYLEHGYSTTVGKYQNFKSEGKIDKIQTLWHTSPSPAKKKGHNFKNHVHDVRPTLRPRCTGYNNFSFWFQRLEAFLSSTKKNQSGVNYDLSSRFRELILEQKSYSWYMVVKAVNLSAPFLVFTALILILWSTIHTSKFSQVNKKIDVPDI